MEAETAHRPRKHPALAPMRRHGALTVNPERAPAVALERHVVVVSRDRSLPAEVGSRRPGKHAARLLRHGPPGCAGKTPCDGDIVRVFGASIGSCVERAKPTVYGLRACEMVIADRLAERSRSAVNHEPEPVLFVFLDFKEVVSAAERCEFDGAFRPAQRLQTGMAERGAACHVLGLRDDLAAIAPAGGHGAPEIGQDLTG